MSEPFDNPSADTVKISVDGRPVHAFTAGTVRSPGQGSIVFVHGAVHDHSVWEALARSLAQLGHAVLAVDLPGHGLSDGPLSPGIEAAADWLLAFLAAAGAPPVHLVGHSMGSLIALEAAARAPERVKGLVLAGTACPMRVSASLLETARDDPARAIAMVNAFSHVRPASPAPEDDPGKPLRDANGALMHRIQDDARRAGRGNVIEHDLRLCDRYARGLEAAAAVRCPVHVIVGDKDVMTPAKAAGDLVVALGATVSHIDAGHALMQEAPRAMLEALRRAIPG